MQHAHAQGSGADDDWYDGDDDYRQVPAVVEADGDTRSDSGAHLEYLRYSDARRLRSMRAAAAGDDRITVRT